MDYAEMYAKTYSENGSAAIHRREQQWESQDVLRTLKRESLRFYEQQTWDKLSDIDAERRKLAWKRQEQRWRDQDTIRLMQRLQKRKSDTLAVLGRLGRLASGHTFEVLDPSGYCQPVRCQEIKC
jgi:hypothetical protein